MPLGDKSKAIEAKVVKIFRGSDEVEPVYDVKVRATKDRNSLMTRAGPLHAFAWQIIQIEFTTVTTKEAFDQIVSDAALNSRGVLSYTNWRVQGLAPVNDTDNVDKTYSCGVVDYEKISPDVGWSGTRVTLLVAGATI